MALVISGISGWPLLCCWTDCDRFGNDRHAWTIQESAAKTLTYVFCTERHKALWRNGHRDLFNLPSGLKSLGGHVQGVDLRKPDGS